MKTETKETEMKHTPGPWKAFGGEFAPTVCSMTGEKDSVCEVYTFQNGEHIANAHLIAAAPELLEVCKKLVGGLSPEDPIHKELVQAILSATQSKGE